MKFKCPYCNHLYHDTYEGFPADGEREKRDCYNGCEREFWLELYISWEFSTEKFEKYKDE